MAVVKQSLQILSGKIGPVVFKRRGNTNYMAILPMQYNMSNSLAAQNSRKSFKTLSAFSKYINSSPRLREIWDSSSLEGIYAYHKIMKANAPLIRDGEISVYNMIAPKTSEDPVNSASLSKTELFLTLNSYVFPPDADAFLLNLILPFFQPKDPMTSFMEFAFLKGDAQPGTLEYTFQLPETTVKLIDKYEKVIIYTALSFTKSKKLCWYSNKAVLCLTSEIT